MLYQYKLFVENAVSASSFIDYEQLYKHSLQLLYLHNLLNSIADLHALKLLACKVVTISYT